jgi:hypothetical protein
MYRSRTLKKIPELLSTDPKFYTSLVNFSKLFEQEGRWDPSRTIEGQFNSWINDILKVISVSARLGSATLGDTFEHDRIQCYNVLGNCWSKLADLEKTIAAQSGGNELHYQRQCALIHKFKTKILEIQIEHYPDQMSRPNQVKIIKNTLPADNFSRLQIEDSIKAKSTNSSTAPKPPSNRLLAMLIAITTPHIEGVNGVEKWLAELGYPNKKARAVYNNFREIVAYDGKDSQMVSSVAKLEELKELILNVHPKFTPKIPQVDKYLKSAKGHKKTLI